MTSLRTTSPTVVIGAHLNVDKRSRASVDFGGYDSASVPDPKPATETYPHSFGNFESNDGYDVTPSRKPHF